MWIGNGGAASETCVEEGVQHTSDRARPVSGSVSASRERNWKMSVLNKYGQDVLMVMQPDELTKSGSVHKMCVLYHTSQGPLCRHCE